MSPTLPLLIFFVSLLTEVKMAHGQLAENSTSEQGNKWWLLKTANEESGQNDVDYHDYDNNNNNNYQDNNNDYDNTEPACTHPSIGLAIDTTS